MSYEIETSNYSDFLKMVYFNALFKSLKEKNIYNDYFKCKFKK